MEEGQVMGVVAIKPHRDAPMHLQSSEAAFDEVAPGVELSVVPDPSPAVSLSGHDGSHPFAPDESPDLVGVVSLVGNDSLGPLFFQQGLGAPAVGLLPAGEQQAQRSPQLIAQQMNLGRQSSPGPPQSLFGRPLFPVAAC
mgnify:CR=1 FL=1